MQAKNGSDAVALVEALNRTLEGYSTLAYYQMPLPSDFDRQLDRLLQWAMTLERAQRETANTLLSPATRSLLAIYGHRAATRALRELEPDLLRQGIIAAAIANGEVVEKRRLEVSLAVYYHVAQELTLNPADLFSLAADYAPADLAQRLVAFGNRDDVTLKRFGWKQIVSPEGVQFTYNWR